MYLIQVQCQRDRPLINVILRHQCAKYIIVSSLDIHFYIGINIYILKCKKHAISNDYRNCNCSNIENASRDIRIFAKSGKSKFGNYFTITTSVGFLQVHTA